MRLVALSMLVLVLLAGCGVVGGGDKIEPESKGGSPILNRDKGPKPPANP